MPDGHRHRGLAEMPIMVQISCTANRFSWYSSTAPLLLARGRRLWASAQAASGSGRLQSRWRAFQDQLPCEFRQCRTNMERQLATHRGGVNELLEDSSDRHPPAQASAPVCDHILEGASQPIQAPHHKRVTCTHEVLDLPQPRSLYHGTTDPVDNDLFARPALRHLAGGRGADHVWRLVHIRCP